MPVQAFPESLGYFGYGLQSVKGTPVAPTIFPRFIGTPSIHPAINSEVIREGDNTRRVSKIIKNQQHWAGAIGLYPRPIEMGWGIARFCGTGADVVTGSSDPYLHTLTPVSAPPAVGGPYVTIERGLAAGGLVDRIEGCVMDQLEIQGSSGHPVLFTHHWLGCLSVLQASPSSTTFEAGSAFPLFQQGTYTLGGAATGAAAQVTAFHFTFMNHSTIVQTESFAPDIIVPGELEVRGEVDVVFYDAALYKKIYKNATLTDDLLIGTDSLDFAWLAQASPVRALEISFGEIDYTAGDLDPKIGNGVLTQKVMFQAVGPAATQLLFYVRNQQSTAY